MLNRHCNRKKREIDFRTDVLPLKDKLFRLALRIVPDRAEAEDIVQETLIRVWNKRGEWCQLESIEAFSLAVARNLAIDRSERKNAQTVELTTEVEFVADASSPHDDLVSKEQLGLIHRLVNALPEQQRVVMHLRDVEGKSYKEIAADPFTPMFNRAVMSPQPPGSVFKLVNGLIGLQEGVVSTDTEFPCRDGFHARGISVGCHSHKSPVDFTEAIMVSCNSYFCYLFKDILENPVYGSEAAAMDRWAEYVRSFGFGTRLGSDFPSEITGFVPTSSTYDRVYGKGGWKALSVISLSIGQGELGCTPLHLANLAATIANRGWYRIPHIVRGHGSDTLDNRFSEKHYTLVDTSHFEKVIEGMYMAVNAPAGYGATARVAAVNGLDICGKTGTAENPHGDEHAVFVCFAPRENPRIAIAVYIENAGFGATWAAPVASLMVEKYLNGEIASNRRWLEQRMLDANLLNKVPASPDYVPPKKDD